jgi:phosphoribosyl-AMP cyclohydrolase
MTVDDPRIDRVAFNADGLVPAIIQQHDTGEVLMLGWMDAEALRRTLTEGRVTFWSRSRQEYWRKGDTSGHAQYVRGARLDCDGDTLLIAVEQIGAACHTGDHTCFDADDLSPLVSFAPSIRRRRVVTARARSYAVLAIIAGAPSRSSPRRRRGWTSRWMPERRRR